MTFVLYLLMGIAFGIAGITVLSVALTPRQDSGYRRYEMNRRKCDFCGMKAGLSTNECDFCGAEIRPNPVHYG